MRYPILAAVCLLTLYAAMPAVAGDFLARNCTNTPDVGIEIETYNSTDANQLIPYAFTRIESQQSATLTCSTRRCSYVYWYPKMVVTDPQPGRPLPTRSATDTMERFAYPLPVRSNTVCFFPRYTSGGDLETQSPPILHVNDCSC